LHERSHQKNERRVRRLFLAVGAGLAWSLSACAATPEPVHRPPPRLLGNEIPAYVAPEPSDTIAEDAPIPEPTGRLRLYDSLAAALLRHPALAAASWEVRAAEARTLQAALLPNPELEVELEEFGGNDELAGFDASELTVGLSQEILLGGKIEKRTLVARLEGKLAGWAYEATRLDVLTETAKAFVEVLAAQERLALIEESVQIGEEVLRAVSEQVRAGKAPPLDENKATVALALHRLERDRVARTLTAKRRILASSWGSTSPTFDAVEGSFYDIGAIPPPHRVANLLAQNPDVARWAVEMELHRAHIEVERAERYVDVTVMAGVKHIEELEAKAFLAGIAIPLPIFDQNEGGILQALADRGRARAEMRAADIRVRAALTEAYRALAVSSQEAGTLRDTILPAAEAAFAAANEGFRHGKFAYLDVLDAQRTQFEVKQQLVDALADYHTAVADVERLIGQRLSSVENAGDGAASAEEVPARGENQ